MQIQHKTEKYLLKQDTNSKTMEETESNITNCKERGKKVPFYFKNTWKHESRMLLTHLRWSFSEDWMHIPYVISSEKQTTESLCGNYFYLTKGVLRRTNYWKRIMVWAKIKFRSWFKIVQTEMWGKVRKSHKLSVLCLRMMAALDTPFFITTVS